MSGFFVEIKLILRQPRYSLGRKRNCAECLLLQKSGSSLGQASYCQGPIKGQDFSNLSNLLLIHCKIAYHWIDCTLRTYLFSFLDIYDVKILYTITVSNYQSQLFIQIFIFSSQARRNEQIRLTTHNKTFRLAWQSKAFFFFLTLNQENINLVITLFLKLGCQDYYFYFRECIHSNFNLQPCNHYDKSQ